METWPLCCLLLVMMALSLASARFGTELSLGKRAKRMLPKEDEQMLAGKVKRAVENLKAPPHLQDNHEAAVRKKRSSLRSKYDDGDLAKRVRQEVDQLLKSKHRPQGRELTNIPRRSIEKEREEIAKRVKNKLKGKI